MTVTSSEKNSNLELAVRDYLDSGSLEDKERVVRAGEALVNHFASLYSQGRIDEDLRQAGYEGLLKALERFKTDRGTTFSTYATHCIIGEIRHDLRDNGPFKVPEVLKNLQLRIVQATEEMAQLNGTMPTQKEIAHKVNVTEEGIFEAMQVGCVSLDEIDITRVKSLRYESFKLPIEDKITLEMSLKKIDNLQKKVIYLIYYEGLTQEEVAKQLGLNQRKVSRLLKSGLSEMRLSMA